jgi:hypothetical protein
MNTLTGILDHEIVAIIRGANPKDTVRGWMQSVMDLKRRIPFE